MQHRVKATTTLRNSIVWNLLIVFQKNSIIQVLNDIKYFYTVIAVMLILLYIYIYINKTYYNSSYLQIKSFKRKLKTSTNTTS